MKEAFHPIKSITLLTSVLTVISGLLACSHKAPPASPPEFSSLTRSRAMCRSIVNGLGRSMVRRMPKFARVTEHLIKRDYTEGSLVKKDDLLFEIDRRPFEARWPKRKV